MKKSRLFCLLSVFYILSGGYLWAQDIIYLKDNTKIECNIQEATPEKIKYKKLDNLSGPNYSVKIENVVLLIAANGNYLTKLELDNSSIDPNVLTEKFTESLSNAPMEQDVIFTKTGFQKGNITQDADPIVFLSLSGTSMTIPLSEVVAILSFVGKHRVLTNATEAAEIMDKYKLQLAQMTPKKEEDKDWEGRPVTGNDVAVTKVGGKLDDIEMGELGRVSFEEYSQRAIEKVTRFTNYIKILASKSVDFQESNKAIKGAVELFLNENAKVQVSSIHKVDKKTYKIRDYLNRVKLVKYDNVEVEYSNIQYVGKLRKGANGYYYGIVSFEQKFKGYKDGKLVYEDRTVKNQTVVIKVLSDNKEGKKNILWDVFLYDVGVISTSKNE